MKKITVLLILAAIISSFTFIAKLTETNRSPFHPTNKDPETMLK